MGKSEADLANEYLKLSKHLNKWGDCVDNVLMSEVLKPLVDRKEVKIPPKFRLKEVSKFINKALYRKTYSDPLIETEDKVGTRVVLLRSDVMQEAKEKILNYPGWEVKHTRNLFDEMTNHPNLFDYQSEHFVAIPKKGDKRFKKVDRKVISCEIQVRTLLQHAFAEVAHDNIYKGPFKNDVEIARDLAKSMALMEATDDYFCKVFEVIKDKSRMYRSFLKELNTLYKEVRPGFNEKDIDQKVASAVFSLLDDEDIGKFQNEISKFVKKDKEKLKKDLKEDTDLGKTEIAKQSVVLILLYYLKTNLPKLQEDWPLSYDSYKSFLRSQGISSE